MTKAETDRILYVTPEGYAVAEDGVLAEYLPKETAGETGAVFLGRVNRIMSGLSCAFVDIGRKRDGFLPLTENSQTFTGGEVRSGDLTAVQLRKEETGEKGAFLSRDLSLAGSLVILMPLNRFTGVSKRITDAETVRRLQTLGRDISGGRFGLVMREASAAAAETEIREESRRLFAEWTELEAAIRQGKEPGMIRPEDTLSQLKRDYGRRGSFSIRTVPGLPDSLTGQLQGAKARKVPIPGGGNLVIDRCEAMTVIDVNSGSDPMNPGRGGRDAEASRQGKEAAVLQVNLKACGEIARQVRLRNIGGIILIDFIDMDEPKDRELVQTRLEEAFRADRIKTVLHGWTRLGLMEMTRKRTGTELR